MHIARTLVGLTLVALTALTSTSCSPTGRDASADPGTPTSATSAPGRTDLLSSATFRANVQYATHAQGTVSLSITTTALGSPTTMEADIRRRQDGVADLQVTIDTGSAELDLRMIAGALYVNEGELTGDRFVPVDPADTSDAYVALYQSLSAQAETFALLTMLDADILAVEAVGDPETMDGVEVQRYDVVLDGATLGASDGGTYPSEVTFTFWIGPDDLWRRVTATVGSTTMTSTAGRWGEAFEIPVPTAEELAEG